MTIQNTVLAIGLTTGSAFAGTIDIGLALNNNSQFIANFQAEHVGRTLSVNHIAGLTGNQMNFTGTDHGFGNATFDVNVSATDSLNFFLGDVANLYGGNNDNWFDGGGASTPDDGTFVLAFGNSQSPTNSNGVVLNFVPGVTAFGFNYDDLDHGLLTVVFRNAMGVMSTQNIDPNSAQGFISFVAGSGETIESISLSQDINENDGFSFYGFQTVSVVPLPPAAFAGMGMLAGLGAYRRMRR